MAACQTLPELLLLILFCATVEAFKYEKEADVVLALNAAGFPLPEGLLATDVLLGWTLRNTKSAKDDKDKRDFRPEEAFEIHGTVTGECSDKSKPGFCPCAKEPRTFQAQISWKLNEARGGEKETLGRALTFDADYCHDQEKKPLSAETSKLGKAISDAFDKIARTVFPELVIGDWSTVLPLLPVAFDLSNVARQKAFKEAGLAPKENGKASVEWKSTDFKNVATDFKITADVKLDRALKTLSLCPLSPKKGFAGTFTFAVKQLSSQNPLASETFVSTSGDAEETKCLKMGDMVVETVRSSLDAMLQNPFPRLIAGGESVPGVLNMFRFASWNPNLKATIHWSRHNADQWEFNLINPLVLVEAHIRGTCKDFTEDCPCRSFVAKAVYEIKDLLSKKKKGAAGEFRRTKFEFLAPEDGSGAMVCDPVDERLPGALKSAAGRIIMEAYPSLIAAKEPVPSTLNMYAPTTKIPELRAWIRWTGDDKEIKSTSPNPFVVKANIWGTCVGKEITHDCPCQVFAAIATFEIKDFLKKEGGEFKRTKFDYVLPSKDAGKKSGPSVPCSPNKPTMTDALKSAAANIMKEAYPTLKEKM